MSVKPLWEKGWSLFEVALAGALSLLILGSGISLAGAYMEEMKTQQARSILAAVNAAIQDYRQRCGAFPPLAALQANDMALNGGTCDIESRAFFGAKPGIAGIPADPYSDRAAVATGPCSPSAGGWHYDPSQGLFRLRSCAAGIAVP